MKSAATIVSCSRNVVAPCFFCTSRYDRNGVQKAMNAECKHKKKLPDIAAESHGWYMTFREELFLSRNEFEKLHLTVNLDSCRRDTSALSAVRRAHDSAVVGFAPQQLLCSRRSGELSARAMQLMTLAFPAMGLSLRSFVEIRIGHNLLQLKPASSVRQRESHDQRCPLPPIGSRKRDVH